MVSIDTVNCVEMEETRLRVLTQFRILIDKFCSLVVEMEGTRLRVLTQIFILTEKQCKTGRNGGNPIKGIDTLLLRLLGSVPTEP